MATLPIYSDRDFKRAALELAAKGERPRGIVRKEFAAGVEGDSSAAEAGSPIRFVISSDMVDRAGDTIAVDGWDVSAYLANPVVLWMHDPTQLPVGKAVRVFVEDGKLKSDCVFASDVDGFAATVEAMYRRGFLSAVSVGFVASEWDFNDGQGGAPGIDFKRQELREYSAVTIPANPEALIEARSAGIDLEPMREWALRTLEKLDGTGLWIPKSDAARVIDVLGGRKTISAGKPREDVPVEKKTLRFELPADKAAELEAHAKTLGAVVQADEVRADDSGDEVTESAKAAKALQQVCAAFAEHEKAFGAHAKAIGDAVKQLQSSDSQDKADEAETVTKAGAHKLSASNIKALKAISKTAGEMLSRHMAASSNPDGEPDEDEPADEKPSDEKAAEPVQVVKADEPSDEDKAAAAELEQLTAAIAELRKMTTGKVA